MAKGPLLLGAWAATLAAAFVFGRWIGSATPAPGAPGAGPTDTSALERRIDELTRKLAAARDDAAPHHRAAPPDDTPDDDVTPAGRAAAAAPEAAPADGASAPGDTFTLAGTTSPEDASRRFMAFVGAQLDRGEKGHLAIVAALSRLHDERETLQALVGDEPTAIRQVYPWLRFMVVREEQMLDLNETVFRTMAEDPAKFADVSDDDVFELFTEGFGVILPGAADEERMARLRGYAAKVLAAPSGDQPEAIRGNRSEIERLLERYWAAPPTPEEAFARLRAGDVSPEQMQSYLRRLRPEDLASLDVNALLVSLIAKGGHQTMWILGEFPDERLDAARLDAALLEAMADGRGNAWVVAGVLRRTGRTTWAATRPFVERALASNDAAREVVIELLAVQLDDTARPDRAWVEGLLAQGAVPEGAAARLRAAYGLSTR